jgi:hypothetical protein
MKKEKISGTPITISIMCSQVIICMFLWFWHIYLCGSTKMITNSITPHCDWIIWSALDTWRDINDRLSVINQTTRHCLSSYHKRSGVSYKGSVLIGPNVNITQQEESACIFTFEHCKSVPVDISSTFSIKNKEESEYYKILSSTPVQ